MSKRQPRRTRASTAHHEAAHAVAPHFLPLAGRTVRVTIAREVVAGVNAALHPVNHVRGFCGHGRTLPVFRGGAVDREQLHHEILCYLAGPASDWLFAGLSHLGASKRARALARRHAAASDQSDDLSAVLRLLEMATPFDVQATVATVPREEMQSGAEALLSRYARPAHQAHQARQAAQFEALLREAVELVASKWPHVTAVGQALLRRGTLSGDEVTQIIETVEARLATGPPIDWGPRDERAGGGAAVA